MVVRASLADEPRRAAKPFRPAAVAATRRGHAWIRRTFRPADERGAWRDELRATLALAWPLILANLTQQLIQATDVLLMGRLGATQLAAATLALNLTFTFNLLAARAGHRLLADDGDRARASAPMRCATCAGPSAPACG